MAKYTLKMLRYSHCKILKVCLAIFLHYKVKSASYKQLLQTGSLLGAQSATQLSLNQIIFYLVFKCVLPAGMFRVKCKNS